MNLNNQGIRREIRESSIMSEFRTLVKTERYLLKAGARKNKEEESEEEMLRWIEVEIETKINEMLKMWKDVKTSTLKILFDYCHEKGLNKYEKEIKDIFKKRNPKNAEKILSMLKH